MTTRVVVEQCWGCNRLRIPRPWTPSTLPLLQSEGRLRYREYLCGHDDCDAERIVNPKSKARGGSQETP